MLGPRQKQSQYQEYGNGNTTGAIGTGVARDRQAWRRYEKSRHRGADLHYGVADLHCGIADLHCGNADMRYGNANMHYVVSLVSSQYYHRV